MFEKELRKFHKIEKQKAEQVVEEAKKKREQARKKAEADFPGIVEDFKGYLSNGKKSMEIYKGNMSEDDRAYTERLQELFDKAGAKVSVSNVRWAYVYDDFGYYAQIVYYGE